MKTCFHWLFILSTLLTSCGYPTKRPNENKLEKHYEQYVVRKQHIQEIDSFGINDRETISYYIGYDSSGRIVNNKNYQFYEYDSLGRISKECLCILSRDPTCSKPHIFLYEYSDGKLVRIKHLNKFSNGSMPSVKQTFLYDTKNRLIEHVKYGTDTIRYGYKGDDTCKYSELNIYWTNAGSGEVKVTKTTIFQYDSLGRKTSQTWSEPISGLRWRNDFIYDSNNKLVLQKDTSLDNHSREPYSCCILYWTDYKYDNQGRLVEKTRNSGSFDDPDPKFQYSTKYEYLRERPKHKVTNSDLATF